MGMCYSASAVQMPYLETAPSNDYGNEEDLSPPGQISRIMPIAPLNIIKSS